MPDTPCPDLPPELARHPKFLILRELGRGGMGVVYQARQTMMNRPVVIKVINRALLDQPGALERFHREVRAAAQLSHPNIVTAYDDVARGGSWLTISGGARTAFRFKLPAGYCYNSLGFRVAFRVD